MEDFDDLLHEPDESGVLDLSHNAWAVLDEVVWTWDTLLTLNVAYNNIKELPPQLGNLKHLVELNVSNNKLEVLTEHISSCLRLKILRVNGNFLTRFPMGLYSCVLLQEIHASDNQIETLQSDVRKLTALKKLDLTSNQLRSIPSSLIDCVSLEEVDLTGNRSVSNVPPKAFTDIELLRWMCKHNKMQEAVVAELEASNEELEEAARIIASKKVLMTTELRDLKQKSERLLQERPEIFLKLQAKADEIKSVLCTLS